MIELVFENYIERILVTAKKRYAMLTIDDKGKESITSKGIEVVRTDWCDYASDTLEEVINILLKEKIIANGIKKTTSLVRDEADKLKDTNGDIDKLKDIGIIEKLILSKKLSKIITSYDAKAAHWMVAKRMMQRGKKVEIGDRIHYFIMNNGKKLISEKAEEADYVLQGKSEFKIDYNYYVNYQLVQPILRTLEAIGFKGGISALIIDKRQRLISDY